METEPLLQKEDPASVSLISSENDQHPEFKLISFLIIAMLVLSLSFNAFLFKHNRMLLTQRNQQKEQVQRLQQTEAILKNLLQEVANFSIQYPEVKNILGKYGFRVQTVPGPK